ncbi:hypothetical protein SAMN05443550_101589 [Pedobacter hartonius]|uniref:Uncharacterized protein n=1 Tax=Pedobacter hartonius TaxID=425514 RepID=A0A1H3XEG8_9SPHI|nr:hypothetical protein SAMN05443550_101589 [Pedobacter hartonius]
MAHYMSNTHQMTRCNYYSDINSAELMRSLKTIKGKTIRGKLFLIYLDAIKLVYILNR